MSNPLRWDPPLVRALADELQRRLAGRAAHPVPVFGPGRLAALLLDRGEALLLRLHPRDGRIFVGPAPPDAPRAAPEARIESVSAPPDERRLRIDLREGNRFRGGARSLVVELHGNQWNALLVDGDDGRIVSILHARQAGERTLRPGAVYEPPAGEPRLRPASPSSSPSSSTTPGSAPSDGRATVEAWRAILGPIAPGERRRTLIGRFAACSSINAGWILGDAASADDPAALDGAFGRWTWIAGHPPPEPVLLRLPRGRQPYPWPLDGVPSDPVPSLLEAMERIGGDDAAPEPEEARCAALREAAERRRDAALRKAESIRGEMGRAGEVAELRTRGDLLLAHLHLVPSGAEAVRLPGWEGDEVEVELDPALTPVENAHRWYDRARRRERADARLPALLDAAEAEAGRWEAAMRALEAEDGVSAMRPADRRLLDADLAAPAPGATPKQGEERLPFHVFRTAGGLEVRVGRSSKDNDRLTFGHSSPDDVWLHARSVPGSHVVLRWPDGDAAPPARDLEEAATLAALYSRARTSGTVAVDWTRRKYVRKPRGAPPGSVTLLRAKTVFVAPDEEVEARMRVGEEG